MKIARTVFGFVLIMLVLFAGCLSGTPGFQWSSIWDLVR
jgi:hypothetical protein